FFSTILRHISGCVDILFIYPFTIFFRLIVSILRFYGGTILERGYPEDEAFLTKFPDFKRVNSFSSQSVRKPPLAKDLIGRCRNYHLITTMDFNQFTIKSQEAVQKAVELAVQAETPAIETAHLLKGIFDVDENVTDFLFKKLGVNKQLVAQKLDQELAKLPKVSGGNQQPHLSGATNQALTK